MGLISYEYLLFFLGGVFLLYTACPKSKKWIVLLAASYYFYWSNSEWLVLFLLATTAVIYLGARMIDNADRSFDFVKKKLEKEEKKEYKQFVTKQKKYAVAVGVIAALGLLLLLKYGTFFITVFYSALKLLHLKTPKFPIGRPMIPLGISYYTLQAIGYLIDVYRGRVKAARHFGKVALFLTFFPQMVEGPIGRFERLADPLFEGNSFDYDRVTKGIQRIFFGLFKKIVIADRANLFVTGVFDDFHAADGSMIFLAGILYTLQIYAEFSGCIDIVIGSAQLFGVPLDENFNQPFFAKSVSEFWRRWHITLGSRFKDYVFYPVSLSKPFMRLSKRVRRGGNEYLGALIPSASALLITWLGTGLWHGPAWKYVVYGLYYYTIMLCGMVFEPVFASVSGKLHINRQSKVFGALAILRTSLLVVGGMLLFRADTVAIFAKMIGRIFTAFSQIGFRASIFSFGLGLSDFFVLFLSVILLFVIGVLKEKGIHVRDAVANLPLPIRWFLYITLIMSIIIFGAYGGKYEAVDLIYGQF